MQEKFNDFGLKYDTQNHKEKVKWINDMTKELEWFQEGLKAEIRIDLLKTTQKISIWETPAMMECMVSGSRNPSSFTTD